MGCTCAPALIQARNELNALFPDRDKASDGCCGDAAHALRKSDHNPSLEGYARAYDFDEDIANHMGDQELWAMGLVLLTDKRTKYLIYEGRILYPDGTNRAYTGVNAHLHHLHLSIHDWAVMDKTPWDLARAFKSTTPVTTVEEDAVQLIYVRRKDSPTVHLASVKSSPRPVKLFADAEWHAALTGDTVKPLASGTPSTEEVIDGGGTKRRVLVVADGTLYGL